MVEYTEREIAEMKKDKIKKAICEFIDKYACNRDLNFNVEVSTEDNYVDGISFDYIPQPSTSPYTIKDNLDGWFRFKGGEFVFKIIEKSHEVVRFYYGGNIRDLSYKVFMEECVHADGSPAGKLK